MHLPAKANSLTVQTFMANKSLSDSDSDYTAQQTEPSGAAISKQFQAVRICDLKFLVEFTSLCTENKKQIRL